MSRNKPIDGFGDSAVLDIGEFEGTTHTFSNVPDSAVDQDDELLHNAEDTDQLLGPGQAASGGLKSYSFWSLQFYQQFFDVDTDDVMRRLLWSILPRPSSTGVFFRSKIRQKPDLYGPFWVCVTLIFAMAISGNIASYLQTDTSFKWHYDFHKVSIVSSAVFGYAWVTPAILFFAMWWLGSTKSSGSDESMPAAAAGGGLSFLELLCVYGYSLAVFIPLSVLWLIQVSSVQWLLLLVGFGLSGGVLALSLWPDMTKKSPKFGTILILVVVALHLLLACGFMLFFFHVPSTSKAVEPPASDNNVSSSTTIASADNHPAIGDAKTKREDNETEAAKAVEDDQTLKALEEVQDHPSSTAAGVKQSVDQSSVNETATKQQRQQQQQQRQQQK